MRCPQLSCAERTLQHNRLAFQVFLPAFPGGRALTVAHAAGDLLYSLETAGGDKVGCLGPLRAGQLGYQRGNAGEG